MHYDEPMIVPSVALGMITPSANLVVERVTTAILASFPEVSGHFTRVPVTGAHDPAGKSYDWEVFLTAAQLLADAEPDVIVWNGTMGASFGFDVDRELCRRITLRTGRPATTATLAILKHMERAGLRRIGLVTPYDDVYLANILRTYEANGFPCVAEAHAGLSDNLSYCRVPASDIAAMAADVARARPDAIVISCTNFNGAGLARGLEDKHGIPVLDSTACAVYEGLRLAGVDNLERAVQWGSLFREPATAES